MNNRMHWKANKKLKLKKINVNTITLMLESFKYSPYGTGIHQPSRIAYSRPRKNLSDWGTGYAWHRHRCPHVLSQRGSCWFELRRLGRALKIPPWIFIVLFNFQSKHPCTNSVKQKCWALCILQKLKLSQKTLTDYINIHRAAEGSFCFSYIYCLKIHW